MTKFRLNPTIQVILMLGLGILLAFNHVLWLNITLCALCLLYLASQRVAFKKLGLILLISLPLACGTWWSFIAFSQTNAWANAALYTSRLFCYLLLGCCLLLTASLEEILFSLVLHLKLSQTFVYGFLAAANMVNALQKQLRSIRYAALNKQQPYHFYTPTLYLKLIVTSIQWSDALAQAMRVQGFLEGYPRTFSFQDHLPKWQWGLAVMLIVLYGFLAFLN
ncbi:MAG TPA: ABC transporter permease [Lactobacillus sp.]|uniref:ABC transporter permease n=1 Tax=Ligilactobacillus murinus TaxID=1622 RepID=UPI00096C8879|nr:ABC transporter permease [Ligilactobacillus murinus]HAB49079.1 ABC transporter permease [Lactobacillus sp.]